MRFGLLLFVLGCTAELEPPRAEISRHPSHISGVVVDPDGRPIAEARFGVSWCWRSLEDGTFSVDLAPGDHEAGAGTDDLRGSLSLTLEPGESLDGLVLVLEPRLPQPPPVVSEAPLEEPPPVDETMHYLLSFAPRLDDCTRPISLDDLQESYPKEWAGEVRLEGATYGEVELAGLTAYPASARSLVPNTVGWVTECVWRAPNVEIVRLRRGVLVEGALRGAPDHVDLRCGPEHERAEFGSFFITCPAGESVLEIGNPPRRVRLSGAAGETLYSTIQL